MVQIIIKGTPISKSNFKLQSKSGKYFLPSNSGKYHDRYGVYEEQIAYEVRRQHPNVIFDSALTAILNVYYKYEKKHPDTNNITKSIFDGIEKSGIILNDSQITRIVLQEFYDKENPRFELTLFENHLFDVNISIQKKSIPSKKTQYFKKASSLKPKPSKDTLTPNSKNTLICYACNNKIIGNDYIQSKKSSVILCKKCIKKTI